jgi:hypothetical protein
VAATSAQLVVKLVGGLANQQSLLQELRIGLYAFLSLGMQPRLIPRTIVVVINVRLVDKPVVGLVSRQEVLHVLLPSQQLGRLLEADPPQEQLINVVLDNDPLVVKQVDVRVGRQELLRDPPLSPK